MNAIISTTGQPETELERATRISRYLTGWVRTVPGRGDVAAFTRGDFTIRLHGTRKVRLSGPGVDGDLRFYDAAALVADHEQEHARAGRA